MEILTHYYFSWIVSFQKQRYTCEMLSVKTKQSGDKLLPQLNLWAEVFLGEIFCSRFHYSKKDYKGKKNEQHSYKIGTWNVRTLNRGGKLENF
jgi:hypothetical protein